ncbi:serine hydrolase [Williamsia sp. D3]|uniref:serine hydrolase domain-containing protein n=1 Tax=Williamsia sp. D3 TaxID=1313067 RepID=UPI0003D2AB4E|nr:serine hydrolase domain-containing protein [Williamsia sp. D3]ETD32884.1 beta-lactamase [Williamsia sp. D3]
MTAMDGDAELGSSIRRRLGGRHPIVAVAWVGPRGLSLATTGTTTTADLEIGSISKALTGLLYADACSRGEVTPETTLAALLPLPDREIGAITLESLSTHRSGLPRLPAGMNPLRRTVKMWTHGASPYGETLEELLAQVPNTKLRSPKVRYSNLGFQLLGHAVAQAAGQSFQTLLGDRLARPLGLENTYAPYTPAELASDAVVGRSRFGRVQQPWTGEAIAPAGGVRASIADMGRLVCALLDESSPGMAALDPVAKLMGPARIGAGWMTLDVKGRKVTWHNGATGGFASWIGVDRAAGTGLVILSATAASVDKHGFALLRELTDDSPRRRD